MKNTKTLLTLLLLASSTFGIASPKKIEGETVESKKVEIVAEEQGLFNLVYKTSTAGKYRVNIIDKSGNVIFTDQFTSEKSFSKVYNFRNLKHGIYTMEVISNVAEKVVKEIVYESSSNFTVDVSPLEEGGKFNLTVKGAEDKPVNIVIVDSSDRPLYEEVVDVNSDFKRPYNISKVSSEYVKVRISNGGETVVKLVRL